MDGKIIKYTLIFIFICFKASAIEFTGKFIQGHFILGKTDPGSKIVIDKTEIKVYCIAPKGESREARKARLRKFEDFFMVTGMATPDDLAALEDVQRGAGAELVKWNEFDRGRGSMVSGADETIAALGANPVSSN